MTMRNTDRLLVGFLATGVWTLVAMLALPTSEAQDDTPVDAQSEPSIQVIHATDIVGLSAFVQQSVRDHQFRPQSMPGLDQYIRSVVRNCRVNGSVSGGRLSATSISC